jgi:hypothetical protein
MALPLDNRQIGNIISTTLDYKRKEVTNTIYTSNPIFLKLYKSNKIKVKGGDSIKTTFVYAEVDGGVYGRGEAFSSLITEFMTQMTHDWRRAYGAMNWDGLDVAKNQGANAVIDYTEAIVNNARMKVQSVLGTDLHGSGGGNHFDGFGNAVSTTATYGGIARDGSAQGSAITPTVNLTGGPFSPAMVNVSLADARHGTSEYPDLIVSGQPIFNKVGLN